MRYSDKRATMTHLRLERSELTYEGTFSQFAFSLLDAPGRLCARLLERLEPFGATIEDLVLEEGDPSEQAITCELEGVDVFVTVRADHLEVHCFDSDEDGTQVVSKIIEAAWDAVTATLGGTSPKIQSVLLEMDSTIAAETYDSVLARLAPVPDALPSGTETGIVYYLPVETDRGYRESSFVLNRSSSVTRGLAVSATLVFEGQAVKPGEAIAAARERLAGLLRSLQIEFVDN